MKYLKLTIKTGYAASEALQAELIEAGFTAMEIDDPRDALDIAENPALYKYDYINEEIGKTAAAAFPGGEGSVRLSLYFPDDAEGREQLEKARAVAKNFAARGGAEADCAASVTGDDSEWLYKWQEYFAPVRIGRRIVVKPAWEEYTPAASDLVIEMDPGMAFGSGLHATTSMCVKALEKTLEGKDGEGLKVLDVGTGTGILAMAAVLLGAGEALGTDIDEEAVRVAGENISKNDLDGSIKVMQGDLAEGTDYDPDIITANLMADLVIKLAPSAAACLKSGGVFIASGILDIKEEIVCRAVREAGFSIKEVMRGEEWRALIATRE